MNNLTVNFIGAGRLGKAIAKLLNSSKQFTIQAIVNKTIDSAHEAVKFIGAGSAYAKLSAMPKTDVIFITTQDEFIGSIAKELSTCNIIKEGTLVIHCSGSLSSEVLVTLKRKGANIASIHPIKSFADSKLSIKEFAGTYCAVEGDEEIMDVLQTIVKAIHGVPILISANEKAIYHAAGFFACASLVTLYHHAKLCYQQANIDQDIAHKIIVNLMQSTLNNLNELQDENKALTGPIKRGDTTILAKHLAAMKEKDQIDLYKALAKATIDLTDHDDLLKNMLKEKL